MFFHCGLFGTLGTCRDCGSWWTVYVCSCKGTAQRECSCVCFVRGWSLNSRHLIISQIINQVARCHFFRHKLSLKVLAMHYITHTQTQKHRHTWAVGSNSMDVPLLHESICSYKKSTKCCYLLPLRRLKYVWLPWDSWSWCLNEISAQSLYLVAVSTVKVKWFPEFESLKVYCCLDMVSYKCCHLLPERCSATQLYVTGSDCWPWIASTLVPIVTGPLCVLADNQ